MPLHVQLFLATRLGALGLAWADYWAGDVVRRMSEERL